MRRFPTARRLTVLSAILALTLPLSAAPPRARRVAAQTPAAPTAAAPSGPALSLDEAVARALAANPTVQLSQARLRRAQEQIVQVDAQARPQLRADLADTLSSNRTFSTSGGGSIQNPTLPGGGQIPVVIDQGGGGAIGGSSGGLSTNVGTTGSGVQPTSTSSGSAAGSGGAGGGATGGGGAGSISANPFAVGLFTDGVPARLPAQTTPPPTTTPVVPTFQQSVGQRNNYSARASVTQYLDIFRLIPTAKDVVNLTRDFYVLDLERVSNETALTTKNAFFSVLRAQALVGVQQEQVTAARESVRIAQARFAAGAAAQFDVVTAQTTLSNAQQQLIQAQNQLELAQASLNNALGQPQDTPITLQAPPLPAFDQTFDLNQNLETAYARRPESRQADSNLVIAQRLIKLAGATLLPTLGLVGSANYNGIASGSQSRNTEAVTAQLGIPLYDGGTTHSRVRSARIDLDTQTLSRTQLRQNVALEVRQAISNILNAQARAQASQQGVAQAQEALRLANVRYQNGRGTFLEVTNAQAQLVQARSNLLNAQFDYQSSLAQRTRALGGR